MKQGTNGKLIDLNAGNGSVTEQPSSTEPIIAVVIPAYKQPEYLKDAVLSAVRQTLRSQIRIIIVNDGCPYPSTDSVGRFFRDAFPGEVYYLRKPNGGLSSARNYGIRFALDAWPSIQAIFLLDADNRLSPQTLEKLWQRLTASGSEVGWAYQDLNVFGTEETIWHTGIPFSVFRLLHENFSDAGSLVRRSVYEAGIWYDEDMKSGYEDWEFFLHVSLSGFRGTHVPDTGFLYRKHGHSMLTDSKSKHDAIVGYIRKKHLPKARHDDLVRLEHREMPRFALIDIAKQTVRYFTDPLAVPVRTLNIASFVTETNHWAAEPPPKEGYVPPLLLFVNDAFLELIGHLRMLPGVLFILEKSLRAKDYATLSFDLADNPYSVQLVHSSAMGETVIIAITLQKWADLRRGWGDRVESVLLSGAGLQVESFCIQVGRAFFRPQDRPLLRVLWRALRGQLAARDATIHDLQHHLANGQPVAEVNGRSETELGRGRPGTCAPLPEPVVRMLNRLSVRIHSSNVPSGCQEGEEWFIPSHGEWAHHTHLEQSISRLPHCAPSGTSEGRPLNVWFLMPWLRLGGVEQCVLHLARELPRNNPTIRVHLALTDRNEAELEPQWLATFETIVFLPTTETQKKHALVDIAAGADVIINAHSMAGYELLPEIKSKSPAKYFSYLHVTDQDKNGFPQGYPLIASREYANLIDGFLVISRQLQRQCMGFGVPEEKLVLLPNASAVEVPPERVAVRLARAKGKRRYSAERPLRILFCGRFDYQKGIDRLEKIAFRLEADGVPFRLDMIGKAVLADSDPAVSLPRTTVRPSTVRKDRLARAYRRADVFLLPSRFEGVPLTVFEALAFGNIVIATAVGAVGEVVRDRENGFLLDATLPEQELIPSAVGIIRDLAERPEHYAELRLAACRSALEASWASSAAALARTIESHLQLRK